MPKHSTHSYGSIDRAKVEAIINELMSHGAVVNGYNPWSIDTQKHGVRLQGEWSEETATLDITVTHADWYVPKKKLWEYIDSLMSRVQDEA